MEREHIELTTQRLREMDRWTEANPPEAGIVSIQRDPHGRFWQGVALKAAADAAIQRAQGRG